MYGVVNSIKILLNHASAVLLCELMRLHVCNAIWCSAIRCMLAGVYDCIQQV